MDPPSAANQKRKRGRPTNASRNQDKDASISAIAQVEVNQDLEDNAREESTRPRKRGRPAKSTLSQDEHPETSQHQTESQQPTRLRRRQPPSLQLNDESAAATGDSIPTETPGKRGRGRPRKGPQAPAASADADPELQAEEADDENEGDSTLLRRSKRNRRRTEDKPSLKENREQTKLAKTKKTGPQATEVPAGKTEAEESYSSTSRSKKKKKQVIPVSPEVQASSAAVEQKATQSQTRRGRKPKNRNSSIVQDEGSEHESGQEDVVSSAKTRKRRSKPETGRTEGGKRSSDGQSQLASRSSPSDSDSSSSSSPPYRYLARRTRRAPHKVIEAKWSTLDPSSVVNIAELLHSVSQPTLLHVVPKQYAHAEDVLDKVTKRLCRKSGRLPFPPSSTLPRRADELDFEKTQAAVENLLSQLDPLQHSVELLRREKARAEKALEQEYKLLDRLSTNARAEAAQRRDQLRKVHVLVPEKASRPATSDSINLLPADKSTGRVFVDVHDEELLDIAAHIGNHMQSMRGNADQIDGVLSAVAKSHAILRTTLQPHLSQKQMEAVLLGQPEQPT
ncbi:CENP-Q, a CENPA-CAD centromere complex subunit-domain-containing protein [Xylariaceae sp. FL0594]|nr:CENP-Q, a CENPA-CAD centromere complex subunit-domain-containing protein [Xylariaceae sp. FL0594]